VRLKVPFRLIGGEIDNRMKRYAENSRAIASWIYTVLAFSNEDYARELHDKGIAITDGKWKKVIKPFVFSRLYPAAQPAADFCLKIGTNDPQFVYNFFQGIGNNADLFLPGNGILRASAPVVLPSPEIEPLENSEYFAASFFTLSPVVIKGHGRCHMARDGEHKEINEALHANLLDKYKATRSEVLENTHLSVYMKNIRHVKIPFYVESGQPNFVIGHVGRFILRGTYKLITTAVDLGLGAKNGLGFGYIEEHHRAF
jgi:CRISPR-associated endoribonuclease Cas6